MSLQPSFAAYEKVRGIQSQQSAGLRISPAVYPALLRELCAEMESLIEENKRLKVSPGSSARADKK